MSAVKWHGSAATIGVPKLPVRPALPNLNKAEALQKRYNFFRFQDWNRSHT